MKVIMEANGLKLIKIKTEPTSVPFIKANDLELEKLASEKIDSQEKTFVVAYLDYCVLIGRYIDGKFMFYKQEKLNPKYLQRIRVYNIKEELLLWRSGDGFIGRLRQDDDENEEMDVVEAHQVLFGTKSEPLKLTSGFTEISEERGTQIILPFKDLYIDVKKDPRKRVFIKTRNYIDYNEVGQATYVDCRFLCFTTGIDKECLE